MATMSTVLTEFSDRENVRTYIFTGHTVQTPRLVIQKRKIPINGSASAESTLSVVYGTKDASGLPLDSKVAFGANVRYPANGVAADVAAALAVFRDLVNSDEFASLVNSQKYLK